MRSYARARSCSPETRCVAIGLRPFGSSRSAVTSSAPNDARRSVRGIGVAVMCRRCGARPAGALASSAARWRTPKRCCSSTTATARRSNTTVSSMSAWVPTTSGRSPLTSLPSRAARRPAHAVAGQGGGRPGGGGAGEQRGRHHRPRHQRLQGGEVLLGERLGRRHHRRLHAVLDGAQHRVQGDDGLARPDLAHEQPRHRPVAGEVGVDLGDRGALVAGERERQQLLLPLARQRRLLPQRRRRLGGAALAAQAQLDDLVEQQLVQGPAPGARLAVGEVRRGDRVGPRRQLLGDPDRGRQRLDDVGDRGAVLDHLGHDLRRGDALRRRVLGDRLADGRDLLGARVRVDAEAVAALVLALEHQPRAGLVLVGEPRLVEERRGHHAGAVADDGLDERAHPPPPDRAAAHAAHLDEHGRRLLEAELADRARLAGVAREVLEQLLDRRDVERLGCRRGGRRLPCHRPAQRARPRPAHGRAGERVGVELLGGGEGARRHAGMLGHSADNSHHQPGWPPSESSSSTPPGASAAIRASPSGAPAPEITVTSSAPSPSSVITASSVGSASPHATISSSTKPTASPTAKRPPASARAAGATPPVRSAARTSSIAAALSAALRSGASATAADSPACCERVATTTTSFSASPAARSAAIRTFGLFGRTTTCSAGTAWMPASSSCVEGLSVGPPSSTCAPNDSNSAPRPGPETTASAPDRAVAAPSPPIRRSRSATWARMSATSSRETAPAPSNTAIARSGSSVWTWTLSVVRSPTTSTESPSASRAPTYPCGSRSVPVTAKFVHQRNVSEACSGCVTRAGAWWATAGAGAASPRSAATTPARIA